MLKKMIATGVIILIFCCVTLFMIFSPSNAVLHVISIDSVDKANSTIEIKGSVLLFNSVFNNYKYEIINDELFVKIFYSAELGPTNNREDFNILIPGDTEKIKKILLKDDKNEVMEIWPNNINAIERIVNFLKLKNSYSFFLTKFDGSSELGYLLADLAIDKKVFSAFINDLTVNFKQNAMANIDQKLVTTADFEWWGNSKNEFSFFYQFKINSVVRSFVLCKKEKNQYNVLVKVVFGPYRTKQ